MRFRDNLVDDVLILEKYNSEELIKEIKEKSSGKTIIDLQYSTRVDWDPILGHDGYPVYGKDGLLNRAPIVIYSAILLLQN